MAEPKLKRPEEYAEEAEFRLSLYRAAPTPDPDDLVRAKIYADLAIAAAGREQALATMHLVTATTVAAQTIAVTLRAVSSEQAMALDQIRRTLKKLVDR